VHCWRSSGKQLEGCLRLLDLDLDVDTRRQLEALEGVDGLGRRLEAWVRRTVSTILRVDWSMTSWS